MIPDTLKYLTLTSAFEMILRSVSILGIELPYLTY